MRVYIIAEAGVNHNGNIDNAIKLIDEAKKKGCDCIKFQTYQTEKLVTKTAPKAEYQVKNTKNKDTQFEMLKKLELGFEDFDKIKKHCDEVEIDFMSTPFDCDSVDMLEKIGVSVYKIASGDITNKQLLQHVAQTQKPIILSTGMSTLEEIAEAISWIEEKDNFQITLLHCTSNYPAPYSEVNMKAMHTIRDEFSYPVGYSDHTEGIEIPIMAAAMGAKVLEKHFTLDKNMEGPDHKASLDVEELGNMVSAVRHIELAQGDGNKIPTESELNTRMVARKSIVATRKLMKGERIERKDLTIKRPGTGIEPKYIDDLLGRLVVRTIDLDEMLLWEDVK